LWAALRSSAATSAWWRCVCAGGNAPSSKVALNLKCVCHLMTSLPLAPLLLKFLENPLMGPSNTPPEMQFALMSSEDHC
jgi:hypothetical protein